jgi:hypothetical protein
VKLSKILILISLTLLLIGCNEDDEESTSSSGTPITCDMIKEELEITDFSELGVIGFSVTCSEAVLTIAPDDGDSTREFDCNGTTVTASAPSGNVSVDMSGLKVKGEDVTGRLILSANELGATFTHGETSTQASCSFSFSGDIDSSDDIEIYDIPNDCAVDGTTVDFDDLPDSIDECATSGGAATDAGMKMFYALFEDLASQVIPGDSSEE